MPTLKKITVGNLGEQLVLKEAGGNGDICLCYIPSEVEANSYDGFPIKYFILTPVFDPLYSIPSPSRYAHFGWLLTNEDFQKELVNTFSSSNTQIQQLEERIETSYSDWLS